MQAHYNYSYMPNHLTAAGREYVDHLVNQFEEESKSEDEHSAAIWERLAKSEGFEWALMSGSRCVARLPTTIQGVPLVEGTRNHVIKIDIGAIQQVSDPIRWQNYTEMHIWQQAQERNVENLFAAIIAVDTESYRWLVMEECTVIGRDTMRVEIGDKREIRCDSPIETKMKRLAADDPSSIPDSPISELKSGLSAAGLKIGASYQGQVGVTQDGDVVLLDYAHVTSTNREDPWYASTDMMTGKKVREDSSPYNPM